MQVVIRLFLHLIVLLAAAAVLMWVFEPRSVPMLLAALDLPTDAFWFRLLAAALAVFCLLCQVFLVLRGFTCLRYRREISYLNEFGKVSISLAAIEDALTRAVDQEHGVRKVQCRVYEDRVKRQVVVDCDITLWEQGSVKGINERCQDILRRRFAELLPDRENVEIHLKVLRLTHSRSTYVPEAEEGEAVGDQLTPGLAMTAGDTGPLAGEALLTNSRRASVTDVPLAVGRRDRSAVGRGMVEPERVVLEGAGLPAPSAAAPPEQAVEDPATGQAPVPPDTLAEDGAPPPAGSDQQTSADED